MKIVKLLAAAIVILLLMEVEANEQATTADLNVKVPVVTPAPVKLNITVIPMPEGYQDSKNWTSDSVLHLLRLINGTEAAAIINDALGISNTTKLTRTNEKSIDNNSTSVDDVMFNITNYKEAKLAGELISGAQLKKILQDRARDNRDLEVILSTTDIVPLKGKKKSEGSSGGSGDGSEGGKGSQGGSGDDHPTTPGKSRRSGDGELLLPKIVKEEVEKAGVVKG